MRVLRSAPILSVLLVLGCSDPAPGVDAGSITDASADDASVDDASVDGSAGDASRPDAGAMSSGIVIVGQNAVSGTTRHTLFGLFAGVPFDDLRVGVADGCVIDETSGPCILLTCPAEPTIRGDGAGELRASVDGVSVANATADSNGTYAYAGAGAVFAGESVVTIEATGGDVPAFSADVIAPGPLMATFSSTMAEPLTITWAATNAELLQLNIIGSTGIGINCIVPAEDGTLTVDAALQDAFTVGTRVLVSVSAFNTTAITVGEHAIELRAAQGIARYATIE